MATLAQPQHLRIQTQTSSQFSHRITVIHPGMAISDMDYFKVVEDGRLIDLENLVKTPSPQPNLGDPSAEENVNNDDAEKEDPNA